ncbi:MAG: four helix bundle protein [Desulfatiglandaceae bacterium]
MNLKSYRDLDIYKHSYDLAVKVHKLSLNLPKYEIYEEGSQLRRSSKGITSTIVEGYGRRRYKADFVKFLVYAHASCDETILHLNFINDTHALDQSEMHYFFDAYAKLSKQINGFLGYVEKSWK